MYSISVNVNDGKIVRLAMTSGGPSSLCTVRGGQQRTRDIVVTRQAMCSGALWRPSEPEPTRNPVMASPPLAGDLG
jgi:hypothetical protein